MLGQQYKSTGRLDSVDIAIGLVFVLALLGMVIRSNSQTVAMSGHAYETHVNEIYDITGRCVNSTGDTTALPAGFYFMRCDSVYKKVIVK